MGRVTLSTVHHTVEDSQCLQEVNEKLARLTALAEEQRRVCARVQAENDGKGVAGGVGLRYDLFDHDDGLKQRIPAGWCFPSLQMQHVYVY